VRAGGQPHPAAAVLFMDWALSREGQQLLPRLFERTAPHPQAPRPHEAIDRVLKSDEFVALDLVEFSRNFQEIQDQFKSIYLTN
jgi:ABC-type Fe3+ transport system substrate-binding protein